MKSLFFHQDNLWKMKTKTLAIIKGNRSITADTAIRLSYYFGNSAKFWPGLQNDYDLEQEKKSEGPEFKRIKRLKAYAV